MNKSEIEFANEQSNKMSDLISREALKKEIFDVYEYEYPTASGEFDKFVTQVIPNIINNISTVDAVEVVRCRDCKWADPCICVVCEEGKTVVCGRLHMHVNKDDFCSYGERKEVTK